MKWLIAIIITLVTSSGYLFGQADHPKFLIRIEPKNGFLYSNSVNFPYGGISDWSEDAWSIPTGIEAELFYSLGLVNLGGGLGFCIMNRFQEEETILYPKIFIKCEIGNSNMRNAISGILAVGVTKNYRSEETCFYAELGPSFNFQVSFEKINFSLSPSVAYSYEEYHGDFYYRDQFYYYTQWVHNFTFNISMIIQVNFY